MRETTSFKNILVDIDASAASHPELACAAELARGCGARVRVVDILDAQSMRDLSPKAKEQLIAHRGEELTRIAPALQGVQAEFDVLVGRPAVVLIEEVTRRRHDLLIRSHARDIAENPALLGDVTLQLFRRCACPVWAVGPGVARKPPRVVAAVHVDPLNAAEMKLNEKILDVAQRIVRAESGQLMIFHAWKPFAESMLRLAGTAEQAAEHADRTRHTVKNDVRAFVESQGATGARVELREGEPEQAISEFVVAEGIDLVVMGMAARTGIARLLLGNTAERILKRPLCSILAVKPDGFVAPRHQI